MMSTTRTTDVPWDLVTDILSRLPVKSVLRFRSVAKSFYALSKDPEFISRHLHRSSNNGSRLLVHTNSATDSGHCFSLLSLKTFDFAVEPHFPSPKSDGRVAVVGSCNGIVCLLCDQGPCIILWNPLIKEHIILPAPVLPYSLRSTGFNFNSIGFGCHNGEYKVVRIACDCIYESDLAKVEIYSTRLGLWREINSNLPCEIFDLTCSVIIKGTPYWVGDDTMDLYKCIVSFDMASEVFETINLPWWSNYISWKTSVVGTVNDHLAWKSSAVGTVNDHLAVYFHYDCYNYEDDDPSFEIWAMNYQDSDEKWTKLFVLRDLPVPGWPLGLYDDGLFIWIKSEGSLVSSSPSPGDLLVYSPHAPKKVKSIKCLKDLENLKAYVHLESLVWINA